MTVLVLLWNLKTSNLVCLGLFWLWLNWIELNWIELINRRKRQQVLIPLTVPVMIQLETILLSFQDFGLAWHQSFLHHRPFSMKFLTSLPSLATRSSIVYQRWTHEKKRTLQPLRLLLFCQIFGANKPIRTKLKWPFGSLLTNWVYSLFTVNAKKKDILKGVNILHKGKACCTQEYVPSQTGNFWEGSECLVICRPPMLHYPTQSQTEFVLMT